jgi:hypothetical protein
VVRQASNDCAANKFGRWLPDCNHSADDFIGEQRKNATPRASSSDLVSERVIAEIMGWSEDHVGKIIRKRQSTETNPFVAPSRAP